MGLGWVFLVRGDSRSHHIIIWIVSYCWLDRIVQLARQYSIGWFGSYCIGWIVSGNTGFYALSGYWLDGTDGMDGALVGRGWERPMLAGAGTGAPPLGLEGRRAVRSGGWNQLRRCCKGAKYLCRRSKIIQIECTQIRTNTQNKIV